MVRLLILGGLFLLTVGGLLWLFPNLLKNFGRLPGDFHFKNGNIDFYFPITTGLLISLIINLLIRLANSNLFK